MGRVIDFTAECQRRDAANGDFLRVADGLPCGRPHPTFDNVASPARVAEGRGDPTGYFMRPLLCCVDAAVAFEQAGVIRALFDRIDVLFATLRRQLMDRVPLAMRERVFGAPPSLFAAYEAETASEAEARVAEARAVVRPTDRAAREATVLAVRKHMEDERQIIAAIELQWPGGGTARGVMVTTK